MSLNIFAGAAGALQLAGSLSGVPYASAAATVLAGIIAATQQFVIHRRKSEHLASKASRLVVALQDQASKLEGSELQQTVDKVINVLEGVRQQTYKYSRYNRVKSFLKMTEVENGLDKCLSELDTALDLFSLNANITIHHHQRETQDLVRSNTAATNDLLFQILTSQEEMKRIYQMQVNGDHTAERIMEAGQLQLRELREGGQEHLAEFLSDRTMTSSPPPQKPQIEDSGRYLETQRALVELHRKTGIPPTVKTLNGEVKKIGDLAVTGGTYSDVWLGMWLGQEKVALKALRNIKAVDSKAQKRFEHEITIWSKLEHKNILKFYGIVTDFGQIHMVSPWQEYGNVLEHVRKHPDTNRLHLLSGAAEGLEYLHSSNIVHGNLKCANILVASDGNARICDFGMSTVIEEITERAASATLTAAGSARWLAPELIEGSITSPTLHADTYSFAMAILELLTEQHPYAHRKRDASVIHEIVVLKMMPPRPLGKWLTDDLWALMQQCWSADAVARPSMSIVARRMLEIESKSPMNSFEPMDTT